MEFRLGLGALAVFCLLAGFVAGAQAEQPTVLYEATVGGYFLPRGTEVEVDVAGNAYVAGSFYEDHVGLDVILVKTDAGGEVLWSKLIIGDGHDFATDLALDPQGKLWVVGWTDSDDFPITPDAFDPTLTHRAVFLMKISPEDGSILYSTFLGGDHTDEAKGIAINEAGEIYVVGSTKSTDFPTVNAYQEEPNAPLYVYHDAFISKFSSNGTELLYSTYFGGFKDDIAENVAIDLQGNIIISGETNSVDFPLLNPIESQPRDLFVAKLSADGSDLQFGTYLGGKDLDYLWDMEMDSEGAVYLAGSTRSISFPTTSGAFQEEFVGEINGCGSPPYDPIRNCEDGFVTKLRTDGTGLVFSSFLGGSLVDECHGIGVSALGTIYVTGQASSADFPGSENDGLYFVSKLSSDGSALDYTFRRYSSNSGGMDVTVDFAGDVYTTGGAEYPAELYVARLQDEAAVTDVGDPPVFTDRLRLDPVRPNPFRGTTNLSYSLPEKGAVRLAVFDPSGRLIRQLVNRDDSAGEHVVSWNGSDQSGAAVPGGVYFYKLLFDGESRTGRALLLR